MGKRGPQPKNPQARQRRNKQLSGVPGTSVAAPPPTASWLKVTKEGWSAFWASGLAATVTEKDLAALRRLFDQRNMHERFARIVNRSPLIDGSKGQPVLNPLAALMTKLASEVRQMEREFGLTPDAGARMLASTASASRSVEELVRGDDGLQVIDVSD